MRIRLASLLFLGAAVALFWSCEGPEDPPGPVDITVYMGDNTENYVHCHESVIEDWMTAAHATAHDAAAASANYEEDCNVCHAQGYTGTSAECISCHQQDLVDATDPNHVAGNYPTECEICHNTSTWDDASFDHNSTNFPLTGAHTDASCEDCHSQGYNGTPTECDACHHESFTSATDPIHTAPSFSLICTACHNTTAWAPSSFNHNTQTSYPLTGAHASINCGLCHANGVYSGTPNDCYSCHQSNFSGATNPIHTAPSFSYICTECHNTAAWSPSSFDHNTQTSYPLTGAHVNASCALCHPNGQYAGTPTTCYFCHESDYLNTMDPDHQQAGFPTECELCHTTITWQGAVFNHDSQYFPIYSGSHQGAWNSCTDCHIGGNYTSFSCIDCHEHNEPDMNEEHQGVPGYVYESQACFNCHPNGEEGGGRSPKQPERPRETRP